jgi:predicted ATPase
LADGTLRVIEILTALLDPDVTLLVLEEPEAAIEPKLRDRLLDEITKGAGGRQIVLSTRAPEVVSSATAEELRLVERGYRTTVRAVRVEEARRALGG